MALSPGTRIGPYEITAQIGVGGMGEVYRATDTNLKRQVAIKVLPASVAGDTERLARFQREAEVLAALNHSHIAAIYGLEKTPEFTALVMELVEGDDLSQLIARRAGSAGEARRAGPPGPAGLPIDEALPIAKQIAEALEAAHEQGIIHRDLKPANIKVRPDGTVKVLDFGLAKALGQEAGSRQYAVGSETPSMAPTITTPAMPFDYRSGHPEQGRGVMTGAGMILGTAAYMAPEQAKGRPVDARADVWAFGVVLFEMVSGQRAFDGEDVADVLGAVTRLEPRWDVLPASVPPRVLQVLRGCLQKNVKARIAHIQDVRLALDGAFETAAPETGSAATSSTPRGRLAWMAAFVVAVLAAAALAVPAVRHLREAPPAEAPQTRFFIAPPDTWRLVERPSQEAASPLPLAVSPDGRWIAFLAAGADGTSRLWVRALDTLTAQALAGTEGASSPFWSPDSRALGFFAGGKLKKIDVSGGPALTVCDAPNNRGGTWSRDGIIVFNPSGNVALQQVSAAGGTPTPATVLGPGEGGHRRPFFLPDGRHFLYSATIAANEMQIYVGSLDSTERTLLLNADANNVAYSQGHLLFVRETTLMAQPFDLVRLTLTGEPVPISEELQGSSTSPPNRFFSVSDAGVLVYQTGTGGGGERELTWFDRAGKRLGTVDKPGLYNDVSLSPDGTRVAVSLAVEGATEDLWVHELARDTSTRLTFDGARNGRAVWSPDGSRLAWSSARDNVAYPNLYQKIANGTGTDEALLTSSAQKFPFDWSPDGRFLIYGVVSASRRTTLWVLPLTGDDRQPTLYLEQTGFTVTQAQFSPDGRFVAYTSDASGRNEVYVQPFPVATGGKWLVSQGGGVQPRWRRDGKELFFMSPDSTVMAVTVGTGAATTPDFTAGVPMALFSATTLGGGTSTDFNSYDVTADGQKFLTINSVPMDTTSAPPAPVTVVLNWTAGRGAGSRK